MALLLLTGCATPGLPEGAPTAKIRFVSDVPVMATSPCGGARALDRQATLQNPLIQETSTAQMFNSSPDKRIDVMERLVLAEQEVRLAFGAGRPVRTYEVDVCTVTLRFTPSRGAQYQAEFNWVGESCTVELFRLSMQGTELKGEPVLVHLSPGRDCAT